MQPALIRNLRTALLDLQLITDETTDQEAMVIATRTLKFHRDLLKRATQTAKERQLPSGVMEPWHPGTFVNVWKFNEEAGQYHLSRRAMIAQRRETKRGWIISSHYRSDGFMDSLWLGDDYAWPQGRADSFLTIRPETEFSALPEVARRKPKLRYYTFGSGHVDGYREATIIMTAASLAEIHRLFSHPINLKEAMGGSLRKLPEGSLDEEGAPTSEHVYYEVHFGQNYQPHPEEEHLITKMNALRRLGAK